MSASIQTRLFDFPTGDNNPQPATILSTFDYNRDWSRFHLSEYKAIKLHEKETSCLVEIPNTETIAIMARQQVQRFSSSFRLRQDCDFISLLGKIAWSRYLGEPDHKVFDDWFDSLKKGNKGIFFTLPGDAVGLRTTGQTKDTFTYSRNKHSMLITSHVFTRVQLQHSGAAYVELLGWAQRHLMAPYIKSREKHFSINFKTLEKNNALESPAEFRQAFLNRNCQ